jgi:hypothetical protein
MSDGTVFIACAFPADPAKRAALRQLVQQPMSIYANSVVMPCARCQEPLLVGPNTTEQVRGGTAKVYCPWCIGAIARELGVTRADEVAILDFGNTNVLRREQP